MRESLPDIAELADRELPTLCAGSVAPDAVRYYSDLGKFGTNFYLENRKDTWGRSVSAMFPGVRKPSSSVRACSSGKFFAIAMSCAKGAWSGADSHFSCISPMTASGRPRIVRSSSSVRGTAW